MAGLKVIIKPLHDLCPPHPNPLPRGEREIILRKSIRYKLMGNAQPRGDGEFVNPASGNIKRLTKK
jgi:hypothetical protein